MLIGKFGSLWIARIDMTPDPRAGVVGQDSFEARCSLLCSIGDDYHSGMNGVADPDPSSVME
jgi:hypothetical protein